MATRAAGTTIGGPERERDRFMDFLRTWSLAVVVVGHWLAVVPQVAGGVLWGVMLYDADPGFWPLTWLFQVIPLFFFVGGFANYTSYSSLEAAGEARRFRRRRLSRLLRPTLVLLAAWVAAEAVLNVLDIGGPGPLRGMRVGFQTPFASLWFLGVYLVVVMLAPITIRLHRRHGIRVPVALVMAVAATDLVAFGLGRPTLLGLNIVFAWLLPHQLGYFYADGTLRRLSGGRILSLGGLAMLAMALLTSVPAYGRNLLDNGVAIIGITAPTLPFAALSIWIITLALAFRAPLTSWLARQGPWRVVGAANSIAMTVFLWHMTAYFAAAAVLAGVGLPFPVAPDATWWIERPLYLVLPALALAPLVWWFRRFEELAPPSRLRAAAPG